MASPLRYLALLSSWIWNLIVIVWLLLLLNSWIRYVSGAMWLTRYAPHGKLSWLNVFNVCGLKYPCSSVKSMSDDPTWDKEDYSCGLLIDSGATSVDLHRRHSDNLSACLSKRNFSSCFVCIC